MLDYQLKTPILFLIFNRPHTAQEVFNAIRVVKPKKLYVATDGPRPNHPKDIELCQKSKDILKQIDWDCELHTHFLDENLGGCDFALRHEIAWFFENEERGIILEDDIVPNADFFYFCELLLDKYQNDQQIMMISGYNSVAVYNTMHSTSDYYFSRWPAIWGWATWRNRWHKFNKNYPKSKEILSNWFKDPYYRKSHAFQEFQGHSYEIFAKDQKKSPWDFQWNYTIEMYHGLGIVPCVNLITNIGQFGYHANDINKSSPFLYTPTKHLDISQIKHPNTIHDDVENDTLRFKHYMSANKRTYLIAICGYYLRKIKLNHIYYLALKYLGKILHKIGYRL